MADAVVHPVSLPSYDDPSSSSESETFSRQTRHSFKFSDPSSRDSSSTTSPSPGGKQRRKSVFTEIGLDEIDGPIKDRPVERPRKPRKVRFRSKLDIHEPQVIDEEDWASEEDELEDEKHFPVPTVMATTTSASPFPSMPRIFLFVFMLAFMLPTLHNSPLFGKGITPIGVKGGMLKNPQVKPQTTVEGRQQKRDDSPTDICKRWSQQSAIVNGTMYLYGGRLTTDSSQTSNTWSEFAIYVSTHI
jgi:hypothetical protein